MNETRPPSRRATLAALVGAALGILLLLAGLAEHTRAASDPPFGSDLPNKRYAALVAADSALGPDATPSPSPAAPTATSSPTPAAASATPSPPGLQCGVERWPVKTLSDADIGQVNFSPVASTVNELRALAKPSSYQDNSRIGTVERTTYTVTASLVSMKREDDRDIHLVIADASNTANTMIVEFPDVACSGAISSTKKAEMQSARQVFEAACGAPTTSFKSLTGTVTLTGVGFFDVIHGQTGVAPNGIELHPIVGVSNISCGAPPVPTPTPTSPQGVCGAATATITGLDKVGEVVTLSASGNLTGWYIVSLTGSQRFNFPSGFTAGGTVQVRSGVAQFANTVSTLWWTSANVWNNTTNDDAALYNCDGQLVQTFDDGI